MNSKYFKYLIKSFWPIATVYITLFAVMLIVIPFVIDVFCFLLFRSTIGYSAYMLVMGGGCIFLAALLPLLIHNRYYSKNRSDIILSMPMTRGQAYVTEGVFGLAFITALLVSGYFIGSILCVILGNGSSLLGTFGTSMAGLPLLFLACVISFLASTFAVSVSNSTLQAFAMLLLVNSIPTLVNYLIRIPDSYSMFYSESINWFSQGEVYQHGFSNIVRSIYSTIELEGIKEYWASMLALSLQLLFWLGMAVLAFFEFRKINHGTILYTKNKYNNYLRNSNEESP